MFPSDEGEVFLAFIRMSLRGQVVFRSVAVYKQCKPIRIDKAHGEIKNGESVKWRKGIDQPKAVTEMGA